MAETIEAASSKLTLLKKKENESIDSIYPYNKKKQKASKPS